jgi:hypothetical protein
MDFYNISNSFDSKEIGCYPQSTEMGCGYNHLRPDSIKHVQLKKIPDFTPDTGCFVLRYRAKLTDFISAAIISNGFIVSSKVKSIMEKFNLGKHAFFPAKVSKKDKIYDDYFWFIFEPIDLSFFIDYNKTVFYLTDTDRNKIKMLEIHSVEMHKNIIRQFTYSDCIDSDLVFFIKDAPSNLDLIESPVFDYSMHISTELAQQLKINNITGLRLKESDRFQFPT